ncbi:RNA-guided endonuclease InsQ/TnpB family protein [Nocardiopsis halotolerans]|uniref:RNA-guided endonuclease InsQ/TnpB family protein n=1 Tax=Nocardiopsis halotolerans TaxID=124252 RepID=UPI0003659B7D|nr:RNA-guided endonuclease TnpB family protein [Nocardiopsis halotolerans]
MLTGFRYRLALTDEQAEQCQIYGDICRAVWNTGLEQRREAVSRWQRGHQLPYCGYHLQARQLAEAKTEETWLKDAPSHILQQTLKDLDTACRDHGTFTVRWRAKGRWKPSFRFPDSKWMSIQRLSRKWGRVKLPKLGWVRFRWSRAPKGTIRSATVSRDGEHWYVSLLCEDGQTTPEVHERPDSAVGVDRGVAVAVATSDGDLFDRVFQTPKEAERERRLRRRLCRQRKGSNNRARTKAALGKLTGRVRARRADFAAQTAHTLCAKNAVVVLEKLNTKNMTASAKGTTDAPGRGVRQKAGLNRAILSQGWYGFKLACQNAARRTGTQIVEVDPAYTSQTCHPCGHVASENRESQSIFRCGACGHTAHADVNAARNILARGWTSPSG